VKLITLGWTFKNSLYCNELGYSYHLTPIISHLKSGNEKILGFKTPFEIFCGKILEASKSIALMTRIGQRKNMKIVLKILLTTAILTSSLQAAPKWVDLPQKDYTSHGGIQTVSGAWTVPWEIAAKICSSSNARLPNINELRKVVTDCGGVIDELAINHRNQAYQACYKNKGLTSMGAYWSSSPNGPDSSSAWYMYFIYGEDDWVSKSENRLVRCVRDSK